MASEEVAVSSEGATLRGTLSLPDSRGPSPLVVVAHGAQAGSRDYFLYRHLAELLASCGVGTLRYDRRGEGSSGGEPDAPFDLLARDVANATTAMAAHRRVDPSRVGLWGVSQGGWITLLSAIHGPPVAALAIVSGTPVTPARQMTHAVTEILNSRGYGAGVVQKALDLRAAVERYAKGLLPAEKIRPFVDEVRDEPWFNDAWIPPLDEVDWTDMDLDVAPLIADLRTPTLLIFGERDPWIPVQESIRIWEKAAAPSLDLTVEIIRGVGHEMVAGDPLAMPTEGQPVPAYEQMLVKWIRRILLAPEME